MKGPLEAFRDRLVMLEQRAGLRPVSKARGPRKPGKLGPGGRWIMERLKAGHPERLSRDEEDALGWALAAAQCGDRGEAQDWLDALARSHKARMMLGTAAGSLGEMDGSKA